jgi:methylmalonyl-CoA mutase N-terminal domain/subunit
VQALRARRDNLRCTAALQALAETARGDGNTMPALLAAVKAYATEGEIVEVLAGVFGRYREPAWI